IHTRRFGRALCLAACLVLVPATDAMAEEEPGRIIVRVLHETAPVRGAIVEAEATRAVTDVRGEAQLVLAMGSHTIRIERLGFVTESLAVNVLPAGNRPIVVRLHDESLESQVVVVTATRSGTVVGDQPVRVEAVPEEEIEENLTIQPGNLSTLLNELAGVRMESTAPGLGGATLQIRGLPGRLTQVLTDGLPLMGSEPAGFGLLQTPPLDLQRVEVIKGVASALYGGSALGGVLNLISHRPGGEPELLINRTSRDGTDVVGFASGTLTPSWGYTLTGGAHDQQRKDLDGDAWADLVDYRRYTFRPRLFFNDESGRSLFITAGLVDEDRAGGSMPGRTLPDGTVFIEALHTTRVDGGAVGQIPLDDGRILSGRLSATVADHDRTFGDQRVQDTQTTLSGETTLSGRGQGHSWVLGAAIGQDQLQVGDVPGVGYTYTVPSVFAQDEFALADWMILAASGRVDVHSDYGTFFSPRLSAVFLPAERWTIRASIGTGFAAPTPFVDEIESTGLGVLDPLTGLQAERAASASLDAQWVANGWEANVSIFGSEIRQPLEVRPGSEAGRLMLVNGDGPQRAIGGEAFLRYVTGPLNVIASYTYLDVTEAADGGGRHAADRIPRHTAELAALLEDEDRGRIGIEISYTGQQTLLDNPYRTSSPSYVELNALAEIRFGETAIFLNAINLTNVRQNQYDPLLRQAPGAGGQIITDLWAPVAGRVFNLGVRLEF
ncbi:MAG: TonB-dependent receptor, partial [Steroidobacteraceae bacterium]|nr:TonB-dependent receptor [Steroidobacteraceae bacterium]